MKRNPSSLTEVPATVHDAKSFGWYLTFEDDFLPADQAIARGAKAECFYNRDTLCMENAWGVKKCPQWNQRFKDLNKCTWKVYDFYNYMDYEAPEGEGVNAFDPSQVEIKDGFLHLYSSRSSYQPPFDCKNKTWSTAINWEVHSKKCPFLSGGMHSIPSDHDGKKWGFDQEFGRFEVRAKLPTGRGTWPAHWLIPTKIPTDGINAGCGWPYNGEIDIMEMVSPDEHKYGGSLHTGICQQKVKFHENFEHEPKNTKELTSEFNTYAVEWFEDRIIFIYNDEIIGETYKDKIVDGKYFEGPQKGEVIKGLPIDIPHGPFFWILNTTVEARKGWPDKDRPDINNFPMQDHVIDYVRTYRACTKNDPKDKCTKFYARNKKSDYNSYKKETAFADVFGFPNPVGMHQEFNLELELRQDCQKVKFNIINILGQNMKIQAEDVSFTTYSSGTTNTEYLYDGPLLKGERRLFKVQAEYASGVYLAVANYRKCGPLEDGEGNHVWKFIIL